MVIETRTPQPPPEETALPSKESPEGRGERAQRVVANALVAAVRESELCRIAETEQRSWADYEGGDIIVTLPTAPGEQIYVDITTLGPWSTDRKGAALWKEKLSYAHKRGNAVVSVSSRDLDRISKEGLGGEELLEWFLAQMVQSLAQTNPEQALLIGAGGLRRAEEVVTKPKARPRRRRAGPVTRYRIPASAAP